MMHLCKVNVKDNHKWDRDLMQLPIVLSVGEGGKVFQGRRKEKLNLNLISIKRN